MDETIVAVATPPGEGGVAIVRLSGSEAGRILSAVVQRRRGREWLSHRLYLGRACAGEGQVLDEVLAVWMQGPRSYTGEDVAEIHCHGGRVLPALVVDACVARGARLAHPGEFTLRAFLAGRLDLAQAESVLALIRAGSAGAARLAAEGLEGALSQRVRALRGELLDWLAAWEAELDFGDEVPGLGPSEVARRLALGREELGAILAEAEEGRVRGEGLLAVLVGAPNAGKSTLWNALLGEERALVTPYPGTTRDRLEHPVVLEGLGLRLVDTAGLRPGGEPVEQLGMGRTLQAVGHAEVLVVVLDASQDWPASLEEVQGAAGRVPVLVVLNKQDLPGRLDPAEAATRFPAGIVVPTCLLEPSGVGPVRRALVELLRQAGAGRTAGALSVNRRQFQALVRCQESLEAVALGVEAGMPCDCLAVDLRQAVVALGEVTGQDVTEEVLDRVFSEFCLGK